MKKAQMVMGLSLQRESFTNLKCYLGTAIKEVLTGLSSIDSFLLRRITNDKNNVSFTELFLFY